MTDIEIPSPIPPLIRKVGTIRKELITIQVAVAKALHEVDEVLEDYFGKVVRPGEPSPNPKE